MADLALLSLFAGLYSVPMYALIQLRSQPSHRARIIAANNILNALFMIVSSLIVGALLAANFTIPQVFLVTGLLNAVVAFYIFMLVPEYFLRFVAFIVTRAGLPLQGARRREHPDHRRGDPGVQPRGVRRPGAADGGEPAADPLHHGPQDLRDAGARLVLPARQGDPDRAAAGRPGRLRAGVREGARGAGRRRPAVHLPGRRADARRRARRVQGRRDEAARVEPGAGRAAGAAEPVGLVLLAQGRLGDEPTVPARLVQPRSAWWPATRWRPPR